MTTTPTPSSPVPSAPAMDRLFDALRRSPVRRSRQRAVAGVCAGLADRLGVSVVVVRVLVVVAAVFAPVLLAYLAAWLLVPDADGRVRLERALRGGEAGSVVLLVATLLAVVPDAGVHAHGGAVFPVLGLAVVGYVIWWRRSGRPAPWSSSTPSQQPMVPTTPQDAA